MSVYVDEPHHPLGRMLMCHMIADTTEELQQMAGRIGVARKWIQFPGSYKEHFDICKSKREKAIRLGAIAISSREMAKKLGERENLMTHQARSGTRKGQLCRILHTKSRLSSFSNTMQVEFEDGTRELYRRTELRAIDSTKDSGPSEAVEDKLVHE